MTMILLTMSRFYMLEYHHSDKNYHIGRIKYATI